MSCELSIFNFQLSTDLSRLQQLTTFLEESPDDAFLLFALAKEYEKMSDMVQALQYYTRLEILHPNYVGTYYHLGKLYEKLNLHDKAIDTYEKGMIIAKKENDKHAYSELQNALDDII